MAPAEREEAMSGHRPQEESSEPDDDCLQPHDILMPTRRASEQFDESGYDSSQDPIERYFAMAKWQRQLTSIQRSLRDTRLSGTLNGNMGEQMANKLKNGQARVVNTLKESRKRLDNTWKESQSRLNNTLKESQAITERFGNTMRHRKLSLSQVRQDINVQIEANKAKLETVLAKARVKKVRQLRHVICFVCSMANMFVMAFWLGRFPHTLHYWTTANCVWLISCRAVWYKWHKAHYFLMDLCYWVNGILLVYLWLLADNEWVFQGLLGFTGTLMISVILFRNSFVPHSLDRVTSFQVHIMPVVQLWAIRWPSDRDAGQPFKIPEENSFSIWPCVLMYWCWAVGYYSFQWVILRSHIERKGYETLYKHMTVDMGLEKRLPETCTGPIKSRALFMAGHFTLVLAGLPVVHMSYWFQTAAICVTVLWGFKNGANFYMTYFWRVYEEQITSFEKQMSEAEAEMHQQIEDAQSDSAGGKNCRSSGHQSSESNGRNGSPDKRSEAGTEDGDTEESQPMSPH